MMPKSHLPLADGRSSGPRLLLHIATSAVFLVACGADGDASSRGAGAAGGSVTGSGAAASTSTSPGTTSTGTTTPPINCAKADGTCPQFTIPPGSSAGSVDIWTDVTPPAMRAVIDAGGDPGLGYPLRQAAGLDVASGRPGTV